MQNKKMVFVLIALLLLSIPLIAAENTIVAEIDGDEVSLVELEEQANVEQLIMQISQVDQEFAQVLYSTEEGQELLEEYQEMKLDELINERLLQKAAEEHGITVSESEKKEIYDEHIQLIKEQNQISEEELIAALSQQGINSLEEYKKILLEDDALIIDKFIEEEILSEIDLTDPNAEQLISEYLYKLRKAAEVEVYL